jgi:Putative beta barrel porin-7 (BBP7)
MVNPVLPGPVRFCVRESAMKRHWVASLSVLFAIAGRGVAQAPVGNEPLPLMSEPGHAIITSPEQSAADKPKEGEQLPNKPADSAAITPPPAGENGTIIGNGNHQITPLIDMHTGPPDQLWFRASYMYMHLKDMPIPQVLATVNGQTAIGDEKVDFDWFNGGRLEGGMWLGCEHTSGLEFGGFILQRRGRDFSAVGSGAPGGPVIARPIIDALPNVPVDVIVSAPGISGNINVAATTRLASGEVSFARNLAYNDCFQFDVFAGFRYIDLEDSLQIATDSQALNGATPFVLNGSNQIYNRLAVTDSFRTRNQLYMGQVGARAEFHRGIWFGAIRGSVAMGPNHQSSDIAGESIAYTPNGGQAAAPGGLLAVPGGAITAANGATMLPPGNAGQYKTDWYTIAPEVGLQVGAQLTRYIRVHIGYNFLYINNVVRPGDLIDTTVNRKFVPFSNAYGTQSGPDRPTLQNGRDDFIAHGIEFGVQLTF